MGQDIWPSGLRVLLVESDPLSLLLIQQLLHQCNYRVTSCRLAEEAISLAVEDGDRFDIVISDILPNEDGFLVLKVAALQLNIPVVMMSWNGETNMVMKYIAHGACDFLIKPVRLKELKNIWQHVLRKERGSSEQLTKMMVGLKANVATSSSLESQAIKSSRKRSSPSSSSSMEETDEVINDVRHLKKTRLQWTRQLHHQFVSAVNALGLDKAVPKKILETMKVQQLTREHVASHLQKYRSFLKKLSSSLPNDCDKLPDEQLNFVLGAPHKINAATVKSLKQFIKVEKRNAAYQAEITKSLKYSEGEGRPSSSASNRENDNSINAINGDDHLLFDDGFDVDSKHLPSTNDVHDVKYPTDQTTDCIIDGRAFNSHEM